jgi:phosphatidylglycerophosphate synthase
MRASYRECWEARGRSCFWVAENVGYRAGAWLGVLAIRWQIPPHALTLLSGFVGVGGVILALHSAWPAWAQGLALGMGLFLAYFLDCADGVVARVTGRCSRFGAILDKLADLVVAAFASLWLGLHALGTQTWFIPDSWHPGLLAVSVLTKAGFSVLSWLRDALLREFDHVTTPPSRRDWFSRGKRLAGNLTDDVPWRLGLALSWACQCYWDFCLIFHLALAAVFLGYLWQTKRELEAP